MKEECVANTNKCKVCEGEQCNKKREYFTKFSLDLLLIESSFSLTVDFQKCLSCDSRVDENCATLVAPHTINVKTCDGYMDKCYASVEFDHSDTAHISHTKRGCLSTTNDQRCESHNCIECEENLCNKLTVPKSRFMCHQCDEHRDTHCVNDLKTNIKFLHFCPKYDTIYGDECIAVVDNDMKMVRGCKTDTNIEQACIEMGEKCHRCHYEMCNKQAKYSQPGIFCIKCRSNGLTSKCAMGHGIESSVICRDQVMFGHTEKCFLAVYKNNVVERGCMIDNSRMINMNNVKKWHDCNKSGCNNQTVREIWNDV